MIPALAGKTLGNILMVGRGDLGGERAEGVGGRLADRALPLRCLV